MVNKASLEKEKIHIRKIQDRQYLNILQAFNYARTGLIYFSRTAIVTCSAHKNYAISKYFECYFCFPSF